MHPYIYRIRFLLIHPTLNFSKTKDELMNVPGLNPGRPLNYGEERISHKGEKLEGTYFDSRLGFDFETSEKWHRSEDQSAADAIDEILEKLEPQKQMLNNLAKSGCDTQLILAIGVDSNTGEIFKPELMRRLFEFNISLGFDLYPPDKV